MTQLRLKQLASLKAIAKECGGRFNVETREQPGRWETTVYFQITDPDAKDDTLTNPMLTTKSYGEAREFLRGAFFERTTDVARDEEDGEEDDDRFLCGSTARVFNS